MTPLYLMNLVNIYATRRTTGPGSASLSQAIDHMMEEGLIHIGPPPVPGDEVTYGMTKKGNALVEHILATPMPQQSWMVPAHGGGLSD